jgi:hypothetical protein
MKPHYVNRIGFTIVITPHARESWRRRLNISYGDVLGQLDKAREVMKLDIVSGMKIRYGGKVLAFLYCRRKFNYKRCREEFEVISVTPTNKFHSLGVSQNGHRHEDTEMVELDGQIRHYCFCCRRQITDYNTYDDKKLCTHHPNPVS